jgi:rubredoxin
MRLLMRICGFIYGRAEQVEDSRILAGYVWSVIPAQNPK